MSSPPLAEAWLLHLAGDRVYCSAEVSIPVAVVLPGHSHVQERWWEVRPLFWEADGSRLFAEVLNYDAAADPARLAAQSEAASRLERLSLRNMETRQVLAILTGKCIDDTPRPDEEPVESVPPRRVFPAAPSTRILNHRFRVSFTAFRFRDGGAELKWGEPGFGTIIVTIPNPHLHAEMQVLVPYLEKLFRRKTAVVEFTLELPLTPGQGTPKVLQASSEQIQGIGDEHVGQLQWRAFKASLQREVPEGTPDTRVRLRTADEYLREEAAIATPLLSTEDVLALLGQTKDGRHWKELQYLAQHHQDRIMRLRFTPVPYFAFLFLLRGQTGYWFVFETFNQKLATYVWRAGETPAQAAEQFAKVEEAISYVRLSNRRQYRAQADDSFRLITHEYNLPDAFERWQAGLAEVIGLAADGEQR